MASSLYQWIDPATHDSAYERTTYRNREPTLTIGSLAPVRQPDSTAEGWEHRAPSPHSPGYAQMSPRAQSAARAIANTAAFRRLDDISFLGALDYTHEVRATSPYAPLTRAAHSVNVAMLADYVSTLRGYSDELAKHLVVAALLHDVGHVPLSHSIEPYVKAKFGYGHHELGERLIRGDLRNGKELASAIESQCDVDFIVSLLDGKASQNDGGDLFSSSINIDTIDGIFRSCAYLGQAGCSVSAASCLAVAKASFGERAAQDLQLLDSFWALKHRVYDEVIHTSLGLVSDKASELFFSTVAVLDESDLLDSEKTWKHKYALLFASLDDLRLHRHAPSWLADITISFTRRSYCVAQEHKNNDRFVCLKETQQRLIGSANLV